MKDEDYFKMIEAGAEHKIEGNPYVILRLDGNSFSKFTKSMNKPFDIGFEIAMEDAAIAVLKYCSGAKMAYVQSDEISILLAPKQPFLANRTQKIASLCAATCTLAFSKHFDRDAIFDCRAFPIDDPYLVYKYFGWRQHDCETNAIAATAYHLLASQSSGKKAHKTLHGKSCLDMIEDFNIGEMKEHHFSGRVIAKIITTKKISDVVPKKELDKLIGKGFIDSPDALVERGNWEVLTKTPNFITGDFICEILKDTNQEMLKSFYSETLKPTTYLSKASLLQSFAKRQT